MQENRKYANFILISAVPKTRNGKVEERKIPFFFRSQNRRYSLKKIPLFFQK
jgi:hypothetical protein